MIKYDWHITLRKQEMYNFKFKFAQETETVKNISGFCCKEIWEQSIEEICLR